MKTKMQKFCWITAVGRWVGPMGLTMDKWRMNRIFNFAEGFGRQEGDFIPKDATTDYADCAGYRDSMLMVLSEGIQCCE